MLKEGLQVSLNWGQDGSRVRYGARKFDQGTFGSIFLYFYTIGFQ